MEKKIRLTRTMTIEYVPTVEDYPNGITIEQMAEMDTRQDNISDLFECADEDIVTWEIVD